MHIDSLNTIGAVAEFLQGNKAERYNFIRKTLVKFSYMTLPKKDKGKVILYLLKMTDYSRQQLTRLIKQYTNTGKINWTPS